MKVEANLLRYIIRSWESFNFGRDNSQAPQNNKFKYLLRIHSFLTRITLCRLLTL